MAVSHATIKAQVKAILEDMKTREGDPDQAVDDFAEGLATVIVDAIQSATVNPGIVLSVDPVTHQGTTTGTGTLS